MDRREDPDEGSALRWANHYAGASNVHGFRLRLQQSQDFRPSTRPRKSPNPTSTIFRDSPSSDRLNIS